MLEVDEVEPLSQIQFAQATMLREFQHFQKWMLFWMQLMFHRCTNLFSASLLSIQYAPVNRT